MPPNDIHSPATNFDPRRSHRFDLSAPGELVLLYGTEPCKVTELSRHGAKLETNARLKVGEHGLLRCDGLDLLFCAIRYERNGVIVEFVDERVTDADEIDSKLAALIENNDQILKFLDI